MQIVHIALTIKRFRENPRSLVNSLKISEIEFQEILNTLEACNLISIGKTIKVLKDSKHLNRESPYFWSWYQQMTTASREHFRKENNKDDLNFSVTFSANKKTALQLKESILSLLNEAQSLVSEAPSENLYQINIDLGQWNL